jgi:hypothetical protein
MQTDIDDLRRQRDLIRDHLRWLESALADAEGRRVAPGSAPKKEAVVAVELPRATESEATMPAPVQDTRDELPVEVDVHSIHDEVRRGCFLYAAIAFALLGGLVALIYWRY